MRINQIQIVRPVYDKLLDTFLGKPDKAWWNDIVLRQAKVADDHQDDAASAADADSDDNDADDNDNDGKA